MSTPRTLLSVALLALLVSACGNSEEAASEALAEQALEASTGAEVDKQLQAELAHWGPVIKASGFTPTP